jgi:eukaryotic-like serine/threonine-protein kinase
VRRSGAIRPRGALDAVLAGSTPPPYWRKGLLYVGSGDGKVYALKASTGAKVWSYTTGSSVSSSPAVVNRVVYVGSNDWNIYALKASTGAKIWSYTTGDAIVSFPVVAKGVVYVGSEDKSIYALKASTGAKIWSYQTGEVP